MDPWFDVAPLLPSWTEAAENQWWSVIVEMIDLASVPILVLAAIFIAVVSFRILVRQFL